MSDFRRRLLIALLGTNKGTLASNWYVINPTYADDRGYNTKKYYFTVIISGTFYGYESDYPFYFIDNGTSFYICLPFIKGAVLRNGTTYYPASIKTDVGDVNGILYVRENYTRIKVAQSNVDIYIWEG